MRTFWVDLFSFLLFLFALLFSVMVHEFGHFLTARHFHMKVTEFFVGFGKRIWSFQRGETEYGIKAIPAGGYCRIVGMTPKEELAPEDEARAFYKYGIWKRILVLVAGSFGHLIVALVLLFATFVSIGEEVYMPIIYRTQAGMPASLAGIKPGDMIEQINGKYLYSDSDFSKSIQEHVNQPIQIKIKRGKEELNLTLAPKSVQVNGKSIGRIGVSSQYVFLKYTRDNPLVAAGKSITTSYSLAWESLKAIPAIPSKIPGLVKSIINNSPRDVNSPIGVVGVARVTAQTFSAKDLNTKSKIAIFLMMIASLNIFVGIFNLLPLLPLDGGHVLVAIIDGFRRKKAARRGVEAKPFDLERFTPVIVAVFTIFALLALLLVVADIFNPVHI